MVDIYHQAEIVPLLDYNTNHMRDCGNQQLEQSLDALEWLAEGRADMLNVDMLRMCSVRINRLIRQASMAGIKQQLIERGRV